MTATPVDDLTPRLEPVGPISRWDVLAGAVVESACGVRDRRPELQAMIEEPLLVPRIQSKTNEMWAKIENSMALVRRSLELADGNETKERIIADALNELDQEWFLNRIRLTYESTLAFTNTDMYYIERTMQPHREAMKKSWINSTPTNPHGGRPARFLVRCWCGLR